MIRIRYLKHHKAITLIILILQLVERFVSQMQAATTLTSLGIKKRDLFYYDDTDASFAPDIDDQVFAFEHVIVGNVEGIDITSLEIRDTVHSTYTSIM